MRDRGESETCKCALGIHDRSQLSQGMFFLFHSIGNWLWQSKTFSEWVPFILLASLLLLSLTQSLLIFFFFWRSWANWPQWKVVSFLQKLGCDKKCGGWEKSGIGQCQRASIIAQNSQPKYSVSALQVEFSWMKILQGLGTKMPIGPAMNFLLQSGLSQFHPLKRANNYLTG